MSLSLDGRGSPRSGGVRVATARWAERKAFSPPPADIPPHPNPSPARGEGLLFLHSIALQRPVVVLSVDNAGEDIIVCAVTSRQHNGPYDIIIAPSAENGLKVLSRVQFDKIATLSKAVISGRIGVMPTDFMRHYKPLLLQVLGLDARP